MNEKNLSFDGFVSGLKPSNSEAEIQFSAVRAFFRGKSAAESRLTHGQIRLDFCGSISMQGSSSSRGVRVEIEN